ncbi:MAG: DUF2085 domain-containing protein [Anaerolineae bacterium]|nr:DUF2085 domain-containing protein [Anaerolineae bacterium]
MESQRTTTTGDTRTATSRSTALVTWLHRWARALCRHWLLWTNVAGTVFNGLPWLAPVLMKLGYAAPALAIYRAYSTVCHQLADRSIFLFGQRIMYSYAELQPFLLKPNSSLALKMFFGTPALGFKVAWSDRMVSLYGGLWLGGLAFAAVRRRVQAPRAWKIAAMMAPMVIDGVTHMISDLAGVAQGFRYTNAWLAAVTANALGHAFYVGNALGSFNSWMRLITGLLFGLGIVWLAYPALESVVAEIVPQRRPLSPAQVAEGKESSDLL